MGEDEEGQGDDDRGGAGTGRREESLHRVGAEEQLLGGRSREHGRQHEEPRPGDDVADAATAAAAEAPDTSTNLEAMDDEGQHPSDTSGPQTARQMGADLLEAARATARATRRRSPTSTTASSSAHRSVAKRTWRFRGSSSGTAAAAAAATCRKRW